MLKQFNIFLVFFRQQKALSIFACLYFIGYMILIFPGYMDVNDSLLEYRQAIGEVKLDSWHPVMGTLFTRMLITIFHTPVAVFIFFAIIFHIALFMISLYVKGVCQKYAFFPYVLFSFPLILNYSGALRSDTKLLSVSLLIVAIILNLDTVDNFKSKSAKRFIYFFLGFLIFYASGVRYNGAVVALFLIFLIAHHLMKRTKVINKTACCIFVSLGISVILQISTPLIFNSLSDASISDPGATMYREDIFILADRDDLKEIGLKYPKFVDNIYKVSAMGCTSANGSFLKIECYGLLKSNDINDPRILKSIWFKEVIKHFPKYCVWKSLSSINWITSQGYNEIILHEKNAKQYFPLTPWQKVTDFIFEKYNRAVKLIPFLDIATYPYVCMFLNVLVFFLVKKRQNKYLFDIRMSWHILVTKVLCVSSFVYILSFLPGSLTNNLRYVLWSVVASYLSVIFYLALHYISMKSDMDYCGRNQNTVSGKHLSKVMSLNLQRKRLLYQKHK